MESKLLGLCKPQVARLQNGGWFWRGIKIRNKQCSAHRQSGHAPTRPVLSMKECLPRGGRASRAAGGTENRPGRARHPAGHRVQWTDPGWPAGGKGVSIRWLTPEKEDILSRRVLSPSTRKLEGREKEHAMGCERPEAGPGCGMSLQRTPLSVHTLSQWRPRGSVRWSLPSCRQRDSVHISSKGPWPVGLQNGRREEIKNYREAVLETWGEHRMRIVITIWEEKVLTKFVGSNGTFELKTPLAFGGHL